MVDKLYSIAHKQSRTIIGLMSGTSVDGLDMALCRFQGYGRDTQIKLIAFETVPFDEEFKNEIRSVFAKKTVDFEKLCLLNPYIALRHAHIINNWLQKLGIANSDIDIIASHGQTVYHAPKRLHGNPAFGNATLQIGDGDHLAVATGIITISDFRQKHIAAGGEGAPLAVYGDYLVFGRNGEERILLNIGGIANFTYLPASMDASKIFSTDTGPGNTLMDAWAQQEFQLPFDKDAAIAKQGKVHEKLLDCLKQDPYFSAAIPKTTGPELFNLDYLYHARQKAGAMKITATDVMATLNRLSADTIVNEMKRCLKQHENLVIYSSGGGMHNPLLMARVQEQLPGCRFFTTDELEINPDAKEAVLFAVLANECLHGNADYIPAGIPGMPAVTMGKISFPA